MWKRDGGACVKCGSTELIEFDHIVPFSKGGKNTVRNVQLLCEECNRTKSDTMPADWQTMAGIARLTGLSRQSVAHWAKRPGCPRRRQGTRWVYKWPDFAEWRLQESVRDAVAKAAPNAPDSLDEAKRRKLAAEAERAELELSQLRGQLVTVADCRDRMAKMGDRVRGALLAVPGKWAPRLQAVDEVADAQRTLREAIGEVLEELSDG